MRVAFVIALGTLAVLGVISATEIKPDAATPAPGTKFRPQTNVTPPPPPPQHQAGDEGMRRLNFLRWIFPSPTASPNPPAPEPAFSFNQRNQDCDDVFVMCN
ncbi:hypothetical protein ON010_g11942 [Phytophthora cinnamomi]|nr:hypothetical protein ON010_g11942 [Phytophthora cinnamomi]